VFEGDQTLFKSMLLVHHANTLRFSTAGVPIKSSEQLALTCCAAPCRATRPLMLGRHRGSGASKCEGRHVRENTMMSFMKAATNHSDFIEFDVHVTRDGVVVVPCRLPNLCARLHACVRVQFTQFMRMRYVQVKIPSANDRLDVCCRSWMLATLSLCD